MNGLKEEYHDERILKKIAETESEKRPFNHKSAGVEYEDIIDNFVFEDYGKDPIFYIPNRMRVLKENGYLKRVFQGGGNTNSAYRLTAKGWNIVDVGEPD